MFVEPLLFGRIIDTLANAQARVSDLQLRDLMLLLGCLGRASPCSPSSAARSSRSTPIGSHTASTRWCERCSSSTCSSFR